MAGIGFELKKIFKEDSMSSMVKGVAYSTAITVGPTVIVIVTILLLNWLLGYMGEQYSQRELLASTILYIFIFALLVTAPFNGVLSRYIADKFYEEEYDDILPSFYVGLLSCIVLGAVIAVPFAFRLVMVGKVEVLFIFISYCLFISLVITFFTMTYLAATKDYKIIAASFLLGMLLAVTTAVILYFLLHCSTIYSIITGMAVGFLVIAFLEFSYVRRYFHTDSKRYFDCLPYFKKFWMILMTNLLYTIGLYIHNFVFWTTPYKIVVAKSYVSMNAYDWASCIAMFTNISAIIIFTVMAETKFHDKYQKYNEAVIGRTWADIIKQKKGMFRLLIQQIGHVAGIQAAITGVIYILVITFFPDYGFNGLAMNIYPALAVAFYVIFIMYCNIIFLYYFDDNKGSMLTAFAFCIGTLAGSIWATHLRTELFGVGVFIGAVLGWTCGYFRIRYLEKHFDEHIFCNQNILPVKYEKLPDSCVYKREG